MQKTFTLPFSVGMIQGRMLAVSPSYTHSSRPQTYYQHSHTSYELHYCTQGSYILTLGGSEHPISAGHVVLIPPGVYHQVRDTSLDGEKMDLMFELTPPKSLRKHAEEAQILSFFQQSDLIDIDTAATKSTLVQTLERIRFVTNHYDENPYIYRERLRSWSSILLLDLYTDQTEDTHIPLRSRPVPKSINTVIDEFFSYNYDASLPISQLAQRLHVSERQLNRILQKTYGMSYREKLNEIRLEVAINFLTTSDKSIAEISEFLGYSSPANFSTFIKSETGKTPSQIRNQSRTGKMDPPG